MDRVQATAVIDTVCGKVGFRVKKLWKRTLERTLSWGKGLSEMLRGLSFL